MAFIPQYSFWSIEKFNNSNEAIFSDPSKVAITGGLAKYIPTDVSAGTFDGPWKSPAYGWETDNNLDSLSGLSGDFHKFIGTGASLFIETLFSDQGLAVDIITTGDDYLASIYNQKVSSAYETATVQFDVRVIGGIGDSIASDIGMSGTLYPSIILAFPKAGNSTDTDIAIIEPRPDGFKIHGQSGAFLPVALTGAAVRTRISIQSLTGDTESNLVLTTDAGDSISVKGVGLENSISTGVYGTFFGAVPLTGVNIYSGHATLSDADSLKLDQYYDVNGVSGFNGFSGKVIFDNIKTTYAEDIGGFSQQIPVQYPDEEQIIYTAPWHVNPDAGSYNGAWVSWFPGFGESYTKIDVQVKNPSGVFSSDDWYDTSVNTYTINGVTGDVENMKSSTFIDMSEVYIHSPPFDNSVRFKLTFNPKGSPPPEINTIVSMGSHSEGHVTLSPNWKTTALPQDVFIKVNADAFLDSPSVPKGSDQIFINNELDVDYLTTGDILTGSISSVTGQIISSISADGKFSKVEDGRFNTPAWRNFNEIGSYTGDFNLVTDRPILTGSFQGDLLDSFTYSPSNVSFQSGASVIYEVADYETLDNQTKPVQIVKVYSYTGVSDIDVGITLDNIGLPTGASSVIGVIEGTIHIPYGPGVRITMDDHGDAHKYFLEGELYREPQSFGIAALLTGDRTTSSTGNRISFGVLPRASAVSSLAGYNEWLPDIEKHQHDEFYLYGLTGYIADHSYASYSNIAGDPQLTPFGLDPNFIYKSGGTYADNYLLKPYTPVPRDSFVVEGYVRPYGITGTDSTTSGILFECKNSESDTLSGGINIILNSDGSLVSRFDLTSDLSSFGITGYNHGEACVGANSFNSAIANCSNLFTLDSGKEKLSFGQWNHIAVCLDYKAMGDTFSGANQPLLDEENIITHGARVARAYMSINGKPVDHVDASLNTYGIAAVPRYYIPVSRISPGVPAAPTAASAWPPFSRMKTSLTGNNVVVPRDVTFGKDVICDFDHFRFGIKPTCDVYYDIAVQGAKTSLPLFQPEDAVKVPNPVSGDYSHMQFAHIFRLDYPGEYFGWDEGYSPNHLYVDNVIYADGLENYGVKSKQFITRETGPKGRQAVRVGPGAELKMKWSAWDERIFNGTGSYFASNPGTRAYSDTAISLVLAATTQGDIHKKTASNSHFKMASFCKINKLPDGNRIQDIFTYNEKPGDVDYGDGQVYLGVNSSSHLVYGTRVNYSDDGDASAYAVGPFTLAGTIETGEWIHLGLDCDLSLSSSSSMSLYISGILQESKALDLTTGGQAADNQGGIPFGMRGALNAGLMLDAEYGDEKSSFRFGGLPPVGVTDRAWLYQYGDISYSELVIGYETELSGNSSWSFANLAATGVVYSGKADLAFSNITTSIGTVVGVGSGEAALNVGKFTYPATNITEAGQKSIWVTAGANDFEGLLMAGMPLLSDGKFNNAESYYAIYNNDNSIDILGSTDSPIQIGNLVPDNAINLALLSNKEWSPDGAATLFDLSSSNINNITNKFKDQFSISTVDAPITGSTWSALVNTEIDNKEVRLSSYAMYNKESETEHSAYYMHLIGNDSKGIYIPSALGHDAVTGDIDLYLSNKSKILSSISIKTANGTSMPYEAFPYDIITSPYSPDKDISSLTDDAPHGFGIGYSGDIANSGGTFTVVLLSEYQSIGETVFLHYPSINYSDGIINMQDSEVYNPVPLMREQLAPVNIYGDFNPLTGYYTLQKNTSSSEYTAFLWYADVTGDFDNLD
jgi:hypothetical protein